MSIDFGSVLPIAAVAIQADGDDAYVVEGTIDGASWFPLWVAPPAPAGGMRLRGEEFPPVRARQLRVRGLGGDGRYAVAELMAVCDTGGRSLLHAAAMAPKRRVAVTYERVRAVKLAVALLASALFLAGLALRGRGTPDAGGRVRAGALAALGAAGALCWWNLGGFHYGPFLHPEEQFHYVVGSKYLGELGYDGLYACAAAADVDAGFGDWVRGRWFRDLRTNEIVSGASLLGRAGECREGFSPERWREFERDLAWFRTLMPPGRWEVMLQDHGYNATPAWGMAARVFSRDLAVSEAGVLALALLDPALVAVAAGLLAWAFGWGAAAVAAIWWGTNALADFAWTGGGFLRQDWLLLAVAGVCFARKRWWAAAGAALAWATLLRVYPVFLVAGLGVKALVDLWRARSFRPCRAHRRFAAGFLAALVALGALSAAADPRGTGSWRAFWENSRVDMAKAGTNQVGLGVLLAYDPQRLLRTVAESGVADPVNLWQEEKGRVLASRRWVQALALLAFCLLLAWRARGAEDWEALVLGVGFMPLAVSISSYYAAPVLLYGTLWVSRRESAALPLAALAAWSQAAMLIRGRESEEAYFAISAALLAAVLVLTAQRAGPRRA